MSFLEAESFLGGYDYQVQENVSYHQELVSIAEEQGLQTTTARNIVTALNIPKEIDVLFLLSVPAQLKFTLLSNATLLVYTPSNEHFGIVPLEAMLAGIPVLAANSGGPLETVVDGETGWLCSADRMIDWTGVMHRVLLSMSIEELEAMGRAGQERVRNEFSEAKMAQRLDEEFEQMVNSPRVDTLELQDILLYVGILGMIVVAAVALLVK